MRAVVVAVALTAFAATVFATAAHAERARVVRVADGVVWLNKGTGRGLAPGDEVKLFAKRRRAGKCVVAEVSESWATCKGELRRTPNRARFTATPPPAPAVAPPPLPVVPAAQLDQRRTAIAGASFGRVKYSAAARARARRWKFPMSVTLTHRTWARGPLGSNSYHRENVDVSLRGVPLLVDGLTAWADAAVVSALGSPARARYRADDLLRVEVHEAALSYRPREGLLAMTIGRFVPWSMAGATLLDGAQFGVRLLDDAVEVGAYAGTRPEPFADLPSLLRVDAGGYWRAQLSLPNVWLSHRGRLGLRTSPSLTARGELDALVNAAVGGFLSASAGVRAGIGGDGGVTPGLDIGFAHARVEGPAGLSVGGGYRYIAPLALNTDVILPTYLPRGGRHHADANLDWRALDWMDVGLDGGGAYDLTTTTWRAYAGPRVSFPRALLGLGGVSLGYQEALGAPAGRSASARAWVNGFDIARLSAGAFYWEDAGTYDSLREGAVSLSLDTSPLRWLHLGGKARAQTALPSIFGYPTTDSPSLFGELYVQGAL